MKKLEINGKKAQQYSILTKYLSFQAILKGTTSMLCILLAREGLTHLMV
jgi:hypothetical protein